MRQRRTGQQDNLGGGRYEKLSCRPFTSEAEKELPDTAPGPQLRSSESASAPRRALVVLRTPMHPAKVGPRSRFTLLLHYCAVLNNWLVTLGVPGVTSLIPLFVHI